MTRRRPPRPPSRRGGPPRDGRAREPSGAARAPSLGGEQVEGRRAVRELLAAGRRRVRDVWLSESADPDHPLVAEILDLAGERNVPVRRVSRARLDGEARSDAPQGVLAHAASLPEADLDELASSGRGGAAPFLVLVDGVTDPRNLGALLRVADGAGVTGALLPKHRSAHVTPVVAKAAAGAVEHVPLALVPGAATAVQSLRTAGVWTVGLDGDAHRSVFELDLATEPIAVVVGAEETGLSRLVRERCDVLVAIPQLGSLTSLNVAAAAAVACYEVARRRTGRIGR